MDKEGSCARADETFEQWYATQSHQLSNEPVCRLIWRRAWAAAAGEYGAAYRREEGRADKAEAEAGRLSEVHAENARLWSEIFAAVPAMRAYALSNPPHDYGSVRQDPNGVHAWLARNDVPPNEQGQRRP